MGRPKKRGVEVTYHITEWDVENAMLYAEERGFVERVPATGNWRITPLGAATQEWEDEEDRVDENGAAKADGLLLLKPPSEQAH